MRLTITLSIMSISSIRLSAIISVRSTSVEHLIGPDAELCAALLRTDLFEKVQPSGFVTAIRYHSPVSHRF